MQKSYSFWGSQQEPNKSFWSHSTQYVSSVLYPPPTGARFYSFLFPFEWRISKQAEHEEGKSMCTMRLRKWDMLLWSGEAPKANCSRMACTPSVRNQNSIASHNRHIHAILTDMRRLLLISFFDLRTLCCILLHAVLSKKVYRCKVCHI